MEFLGLSTENNLPKWVTTSEGRLRTGGQSQGASEDARREEQASTGTWDADRARLQTRPRLHSEPVCRGECYINRCDLKGPKQARPQCPPACASVKGHRHTNNDFSYPTRPCQGASRAYVPVRSPSYRLRCLQATQELPEIS